MTLNKARKILKDSGLIGKINKKDNIERWYIPGFEMNIHRPLLEIDFHFKEIVTAKYAIKIRCLEDDSEEIAIGGRYDFRDAGFNCGDDSYKAMIEYAFNIWKEVRETVKAEKMNEIKNAGSKYDV